MQDLKYSNTQSLATQATKGEQLVSMMPAIKKASGILADDIVELSTENEALQNKTGDEKSLEESKAKLLKQIDDEKRAKLILSRKQKQMKTLNNGLIFLIIDCGKAKLKISSLKKTKYKI